MGERGRLPNNVVGLPTRRPTPAPDAIAPSVPTRAATQPEGLGAAGREAWTAIREAAPWCATAVDALLVQMYCELTDERASLRRRIAHDGRMLKTLSRTAGDRPGGVRGYARGGRHASARRGPRARSQQQGAPRNQARPPAVDGDVPRRSARPRYVYSPRMRRDEPQEIEEYRAKERMREIEHYRRAGSVLAVRPVGHPPALQRGRAGRGRDFDDEHGKPVLRRRSAPQARSNSG